MLKNDKIVYRQNSKYPLSGKDKKASGSLLRNLRKAAAISDEFMAEKLEIHPSTLEKWELATNSINPNKLGDIVRILKSRGAENSDLLEFSKHVRPYMAKQEGWLKEKIEKNNTEHLNFPALDLKWLRTQPEENYLPWLVAAHRVKAEVTQEDIGEKTNRKQVHISEIEKGVYDTKISTLMHEFESIGLDGKAIRDLLVPQFSSLVTSKNETEKADGLLRFYRKLLGKSVEEMVAHTHINRKTILKMEAGERPIPDDAQQAFVSYFRSLKETDTGVMFDDAAERHFARACKISCTGKGVGIKNATSHFGCIIPSYSVPEPQRSAQI